MAIGNEPSASKGRVICDLNDLQNKLNEHMRDESFRQQLSKDPIETLRREGVILPKEKEQDINEFFRSQATAVTGSSLRPGVSKAAAEVVVTVGVRF